jgi:hypothetical protein
VRVSPTSRAVVIEGNDFAGLSNPPQITNSAPDTVIRNNRVS